MIFENLYLSVLPIKNLQTMYLCVLTFTKVMMELKVDWNNVWAAAPPTRWISL